MYLRNNTGRLLTCRTFACVCTWQAPPCTSCLLHFWQPGSLRSTAADPPSHLLYSPGNWCSHISYPALRDNSLLLPPSSLYRIHSLRSKTTKRVTHRTDNQPLHIWHKSSSSRLNSHAILQSARAQNSHVISALNAFLFFIHTFLHLYSFFIFNNNASFDLKTNQHLVCTLTVYGMYIMYNEQQCKIIYM